METIPIAINTIVRVDTLASGDEPILLPTYKKLHCIASHALGSFIGDHIATFSITELENSCSSFCQRLNAVFCQRILDLSRSTVVSEMLSHFLDSFSSKVKSNRSMFLLAL